VRNGYIGNGPWAIDVIRPGRYEITLRRWPSRLHRAMNCVRASIKIGDVERALDLSPSATHATFAVSLPKGPAMLLTTLRRPDGKEHGAYFASIRTVE
jgi:hypothetical protein